MASNALCRPSRVYSETTGTLSPLTIASRANFNSPRRSERWKSLPLLRITVGARLPFQSQNKPNETLASDSRIGELQRSVDSQTEVKQFSSIGTTQMPLVSMKEWNLTDKHLFMLSVIACVTGGAVTALFVAAIPTLLAFKRAAESLERLLEVTREELPGTMAAVRLSGMEISDLTMELSELGQEISSGVKSSARAVRAAQDGLRRVSSIASMAYLQEHAAAPVESMKPAVALAARSLRERLIQLRTIFRSIATLKYLTGWAGKFWTMRRRQLP